MFARLATSLTLAFLCLVVGADAAAQTISFGKSVLPGTGLNNPTSLQFGPDGLLYVSEQGGLIKSYTITRNAANDYSASLVDTITLVRDIPNHDDDGAPNISVNKRQVTGILVVGTSLNPVIYVASSDPRIGGGANATNTFLDTNSGVLSRLTWNGIEWDKLDLVRGLPRSEENHASNGLQLDEATNTLYIAQGGHTNQGAPSHNLVDLPEYALSAAILSVDLDAIGESTYDLPTLDDEDQLGDPDTTDPFGGNDGKNQAILVVGGPVQVHSPGWRNIYDLVITRAGRMYTIDNGPNVEWGAVPAMEGPAGNCTNALQEPGYFAKDNLHFVSGPGYYGGHPNPTRANTANVFNPSQPQSPVPSGNPVECDYRDPGVDDGALAVFQASTNGLVEYTATNFVGALDGDLLTASFSNIIYRIKLNASGDTAVLVEPLFSSVGSTPLDVTARGDADSFPGTVWVTDYAGDNIVVYEPDDIATCSADVDCDDGEFCTGVEWCDTGLCSPGTTPCPGQVCDEDGDACLPIPSGDALIGGLLYDRWWVEAGVAAPTGKHPLYPPSGLKTGETTFRCKECHGWDYKGAAGAYSSGSHYTGIAGVFGSTLTPGEMFDLIKTTTPPSGHGFGGYGLSDVDIADLVQFLQDLVIDTDTWIDPMGLFLGDPVAGEDNYSSGGPGAPCSACHGADGTGINFGTPEDPEWLGTVASVNPWEALHKMRFGQPGTVMPSGLDAGADEQDLADIGRYIQLNFPVECLDATHCDDGNPCTTAACVAGFCEQANNTVPCDDALACTGSDTCSGGLCIGTPSHAACADGNACTDDVCVVAVGCTNQPNTDPCDDDVACTSNDTCTDAVCIGTDSCSAPDVCDFVTEQCGPPPSDDDNDGLFGSYDPCPADALNQCFGNVAVDQGTGTPIRINAHAGSADCSGQKTDCNGQIWHADFGFNLSASANECNLGGGGAGCVISGIDAIFGCDGSQSDTQDIFRCEHSDKGSMPELSYDFDIPNGDYVVNFLFANTYSGTTTEGSRVFDIAVEGELVYSGFDQVAAAGGSAVAVVRSAVVAVADGDGLQLEFLHQVENPSIKGIEVRGASPVTTTTTTTVTTTSTSLPIGSCIAGDCNQQGGVDVGDPICGSLCLIGAPPPGADCVCAADCNCVAGLEAADPICTVLRQLGMFDPDPCLAPLAEGSAWGMSLVAPADDNDDLSAVAVRLSAPRAARGGRLKRALRVRGADAAETAGARFVLAIGEGSPEVRLSRRLRRRGFLLDVGQPSGGETIALVRPPLVQGVVSAMRRGRVLQIFSYGPDLSLTDSQLASTKGFPIRR